MFALCTVRPVGTDVWSTAEVASANRLLATEAVEHIPDPKEPPPALSLKQVQASIKVAMGTQVYHRESKFFNAYWKAVVLLISTPKLPKPIDSCPLISSSLISPPPLLHQHPGAPAAAAALPCKRRVARTTTATLQLITLPRTSWTK